MLKNEEASAKELHDFCDYIVWMDRNFRDLNFSLTDEQRIRCRISDGRKLYSDYGANEILYAVYDYQFFQTLIEFIDILDGTIDWKTEATEFNKYFPNDRTEFPKYIYYSAHNDNLSSILRAIDYDKYKFWTARPSGGI